MVRDSHVVVTENSTLLNEILFKLRNINNFD
jgi:hypothetical protein